MNVRIVETFLIKTGAGDMAMNVKVGETQWMLQGSGV